MERDDDVTHVGQGPEMTLSTFGRGGVTVPTGQRHAMDKPVIATWDLRGHVQRRSAVGGAGRGSGLTGVEIVGQLLDPIVAVHPEVRNPVLRLACPLRKVLDDA